MTIVLPSSVYPAPLIVTGPDARIRFERRVQRPWTEADDRLLQTLWETASTTADIALALGRTTKSVTSRAWNLSLPKRKRGARPREHADELVTLLWPTAMPLQKIAIICGYANTQSVRYRAKALGLPNRVGGKIPPQVTPTVPRISLQHRYDATAAKLDARLALAAEKAPRK